MDKSANRKVIVLASGGTGGHIFPAEALARELKSRDYNPILITDDRYLKYSSNIKDLESHVIRSSTIERGFFKRLLAAFNIALGYFQARRLLKTLNPSVVIGFGGYPSFPTMLAGIRFAKKKPSVKTVIHEQNSMLGKANYVLAPKVDVIATSFSDVSGVSDDDVKKVNLTGNPVRSSIKHLQDMQYPELLEDGTLRILITGGSQGASIFSRVVPEALKLLPDDFRSRIRIDQQCRGADLESAKSAYKEIGVSADLTTFFNDMPSRLASAHLVIARSGATTLAELTVAGRPIIMVPYPYSTDGHQMVNANSLEDNGGGWVIPEDAFTPEALASRLEAFLNLPAKLNEAAENAKKSSIPDADKNLADLVETLANSGKNGNISSDSSVLDAMEMEYSS